MCKLFLSLFLILNSIASLSQTIKVEGVLINKSDSTKLSNIHIFTSNKKIATVSDEHGSFSLTLPVEYKDSFLFFTGIGFKKDSLLISNASKEYIISLEPDNYVLQEVFIIPDSTLLTLLRKAYNRISVNYPTTPTLHEGFYRESSQNENKEQADFIEAHLFIYKDPYDNPSDDPGKVELLKSRKRKIRNAGILYYGGPFIPINSDVVLKRKSYINPRNFRKFNYEFNGIKALGNQEFYEIAFSTASKDTSLVNGVMLIEKESLAYVSFELRSTTNYTHPVISKRVSHSKTYYEKTGDKWYFKSYVSEKEDFFRSGDKRIFGKIDYITTSIQTDSVKPIPYNRQLSFLEPFVLKAEEYDPKGWADYDLLRNAENKVSNLQFSIEKSEEIFTQKPTSEERMVKNMLKLGSIISKTYMDIGLIYNPVTLNTINHNFHFQPNKDIVPFQISRNQAKETQYPLIYGSLGYRLNKNISLVYESGSDMFNKGISSSERRLGITFQKNLRSTGRLLFIEGSLMGALRNNYASLGKYDSPTPFSIDGKKIDANKLSFWYGVQQQAITPQIALKRNTSRFFSLKLFLAYHIEINKKDVFRIKEENGGLFSKKTATIRATDPALAFNNDHKEIWNSLMIPKCQAGIALVFN